MSLANSLVKIFSVLEMLLKLRACHWTFTEADSTAWPTPSAHLERRSSLTATKERSCAGKENSYGSGD